MQLSKLGVTCYLSGLTIGDVTYDGTLTGDFNKATAEMCIRDSVKSLVAFYAKKEGSMPFSTG